jgi:cation:H+ antiporter
MLILWGVVFIISLIVLVKSADWLIESAEKIGLALGLSPFIIGVTIVSIGTSFPEVATSLMATFKGMTDVAVANAVGSNIANILLVIGISAIVGRKLVMTRSLIDIDLPLLAIATVLFLGTAWDGVITLGESLLLVATYGTYLLYAVLHKDRKDENLEKSTETIPSRQDRRSQVIINKGKNIRPKIATKDIVFLILGVVGLVFGAKYLIDSLIKLSTALNIAAGVIAITAVAVGTSLPELLVSAKAAFRNKPEVALGNIFGSNVFNLLIVVGLPGLFRTLSMDVQTLSIGLPVMAAATLLFIISGISQKIHIWEGAFFLSVYIFFVGKLFNWF